MSSPVTIKIKRERVIGAGNHLLRSWLYSYTTPVDVEWVIPASAPRLGPRAGDWITYGHGLESLRDMLRRKYGRDVKITETWKEEKSDQLGDGSRCCSLPSVPGTCVAEKPHRTMLSLP
jgi:hypothetical protein